jgi:hypothetical protein
MNKINECLFEICECVNDLADLFSDFILSKTLQESKHGQILYKKAENKCQEIHGILIRLLYFVNDSSNPPDQKESNGAVDIINLSTESILSTQRIMKNQPETYDDHDLESVSKLLIIYSELLEKIRHAIHQINLKFPTHKISRQLDAIK